ncbi:putative reverse transcriptase domain-containing protein [Tanacetum coccineum]
MEESLSKFMAESAKIHEENSNFIKEIRASTDAAIRNQGASIKALEIHIGQISKLIRPRYAVLDPADTPYRAYKTEGSYGLKDLDAYSIMTTLLDDALPLNEKDPRRIAENMLVGIDKFVFPVDFIVLDMPKDIKTPLILGRPLLSTAHAKIDVFKKKMALRVGNDHDVFKSDKPASNIIKRLRRIQVKDLGPTIEEGEVIDEPMKDIVKTRHYDKVLECFDEYPSSFDYDRRIKISCAYNLQFSCMIRYEDVNGKNVVGAFMNVPIFVGNFSIVTNFAVVENLDSYCDEGMGDVIVEKPFCRDACIEAKRFDGMITIHNGNDSVTH